MGEKQHFSRLYYPKYPKIPHSLFDQSAQLAKIFELVEKKYCHWVSVVRDLTERAIRRLASWSKSYWAASFWLFQSFSLNSWILHVCTLLHCNAALGRIIKDCGVDKNGTKNSQRITIKTAIKLFLAFQSF